MLIKYVCMHACVMPLLLTENFSILFSSFYFVLSILFFIALYVIALLFVVFGLHFAHSVAGMDGWMDARMIYFYPLQLYACRQFQLTYQFPENDDDDDDDGDNDHVKDDKSSRNKTNNTIHT